MCVTSTRADFEFHIININEYLLSLLLLLLFIYLIYFIKFFLSIRNILLVEIKNGSYEKFALCFDCGFYHLSFSKIQIKADSEAETNMFPRSR